MKAYARINVTLEKGTKETKKIYKEFKEKMQKYLYSEEMELYRIPIDVEEYAYAKKLTDVYEDEKDGLEISDLGYLERVYTKKDYENAVAYRVWFLQGAYNEYDDVESEDENCCVENRKHGMCNMVQVRPQYLPKREFGKKNCAQLDYRGYAVSKEVRDDLIELGATEEDFWPVYTKKKEIVCYQLMPKHKVSLGEVNGWQKEIVCPYCGYANYHEDESQPILIDKQTLEELKVLNATEETLGGAPMYLIINKETYEFLTKKYKRMNFEPIFLKE